jgi:hypothetical protein
MSQRSLVYVRRAYGVPAHRGTRVTVTGRPGRITCASGAYIRVRFDGEPRSRLCHPTWGVEYEPGPTTTKAAS